MALPGAVLRRGLRKASPLLRLRVNTRAGTACVGCVVLAFGFCCHNVSLWLKFVAEFWQRKPERKATERPMSRRVDLPKGWTKKWPQCDPKVGAAVNDFYDNMSSSHSWSSQTYSFSSLAKKYLDESISEYFCNNEIFAGLLPFSEHLKKGDTAAINWLDQIASNHFLDTECLCYDSLSDTLETIRDVVIVCANFKSKDGKIRSLGNEDEGEDIKRKRASRATGKSKFDRMPPYLKNFLGLVPGVYCEVCDQLTEYELEKSDHVANDIMLRDGFVFPVDEMDILLEGYSRKYCSEHNRYKNRPGYYKGNRTRTALYSLMYIKREGEKILHGRSRTKHGELRSVAYQVVQASSHADLKRAIQVAERFASTIPESPSEEEDLKADMQKAYDYFFQNIRN